MYSCSTGISFKNRRDQPAICADADTILPFQTFFVFIKNNSFENFLRHSTTNWFAEQDIFIRVVLSYADSCSCFLKYLLSTSLRMTSASAYLDISSILRETLLLKVVYVRVPLLIFLQSSRPQHFQSMTTLNLRRWYEVYLLCLFLS